jgi:ABC-type polysaccharide/polyol phosphate export permease
MAPSSPRPGRRAGAPSRGNGAGDRNGNGQAPPPSPPAAPGEAPGPPPPWSPDPAGPNTAPGPPLWSPDPAAPGPPAWWSEPTGPDSTPGPAPAPEPWAPAPAASPARPLPSWATDPPPPAGAVPPYDPRASAPGDTAPAGPRVAPVARPRRRDAVPDEPAADLVFTRRLRPWTMLRELFRSGELVRALTERDFRARYKQTKVGFAWALLTPLLLMVAFSLFFKTAADIDTGDIPYPLFAFVALVPWTLFSNSVSTGAVSITQNLSLVNKVYCPREVFPLSSIGIAGVDAVISLSMLALLFVIYGEAPQPESVWVLVLLPIQLAFTIGVTLLLSALVVYLRDVRQILPMALQFALFATPVAYAFDVLDARWQPLASAVNPLAPIIDSYRQTVLYGNSPEWDLLGIAAGVSFLWLVVGYLLFKRLETGFADVA